ncbi:MAG TPA: hypothetical protein VGD26_05885 [Chitinophagaceae bacterium]
MKPLFILLTVLSSILSTASFAADGKVSREVLESFNNTFANAKEVDWTISETFYKAQFALDGQYISAFYDCEGKLMAITRNISSRQLPLTLQTSLRKEFNNYWITDLFEVANDEGTSYYITLESADAKMVLKSKNNASWTTFQKTKKV